MRYLPIFLRIAGQPCLIVGGGATALAKARALASAGAHLVVTAPSIRSELVEMPGVKLCQRRFRESDVQEMRLAVAAADDAAVNEAVGRACAAEGVLCCRSDAAEQGDFIIPARVSRGKDFIAAVSTCGAAPAVAKRLAAELEDWIPDGFAEYVEFAARVRERVRRTEASPERRKEIARAIASRESQERFCRMTPEEREEWLEELLGGNDK
jgi:siroheme synthase-like protein